MTAELHQQKCQACEGNVEALKPEQVNNLMSQLSEQWKVDAECKILTRIIDFKNYYHTMAFVNAVAWVAHQENHHPDLSVHYNRCVVSWNTHAIGGLSMNDFICAAKTDKLLQKS
jgi:4a-hydroxytetrahydrobiopterin dehydratase